MNECFHLPYSLEKIENLHTCTPPLCHSIGTNQFRRKFYSIDAKILFSWEQRNDIAKKFDVSVLTFRARHITWQLYAKNFKFVCKISLTEIIHKAKISAFNIKEKYLHGHILNSIPTSERKRVFSSNFPLK